MLRGLSDTSNLNLSLLNYAPRCEDLRVILRVGRGTVVTFTPAGGDWSTSLRGMFNTGERLRYPSHSKLGKGPRSGVGDVEDTICTFSENKSPIIGSFNPWPSHDI